MKSYWDLTEKERAALTAEQVEEFVDVELMQAATVRVRELVLVEEPPMPEPDVTVYQLQHTHWHPRDLCFATADAAIASARDHVGSVEDERLGGSHDYAAPSVGVIKPIDPEALVAKAVHLYSPGRVAGCREQLEKALSARKENEQRKTAHKEAAEKQRKALEGMWSDWHVCRSKADDLARVLATRSEYVRMSNGDETIALGFLRRTFGDDKVTEAMAWGA